MFADRIFGIAIVVSSLCHLFWISAVDIVVTPMVKPGGNYQEVDFLGPILEKTAFDFMAEGSAHYGETQYTASSIFFMDKVYLVPAGPKRNTLKRTIPEEVMDRFSFNLQGYIKDVKETPFYMATEKDFILMEEEEKPEVKGPLKQREIIYKPDPPVVSLGPGSEKEVYTVQVKFAISHNGIVYRAEPVVSSGRPKIDMAAIRYVKEWRFSPLSLVEREENNWGIATVNIMSR